jgi:hypothetical protein
MTSPERLARRARNVATRAKSRDTSVRSYCTIPDCRNLTSAAAGKGLNTRFCRKHEDGYERHGSPYTGSYGAMRINPYRRAAFDWLTENAKDFWVEKATAGVQKLYDTAGPVVEAFRLWGLKPEERARAAWARLRSAQIDPRLPLAAWLAVEMITRDDPGAIKTKEYKRVQAAKVIHRMVSGTHKQWEQERLDGRGTTVTELHKFPMSRGRVLRHIGEDVERVAELVAHQHLAKIIAFKHQREGEGKIVKRAHPGRIRRVAKTIQR